MSAQSVVLTGAAGFLGVALVAELKQAHEKQLIQIDRLLLLDNKAIKLDNSSYLFNIESHIIDIRDAQSLTGFLEGIDVVIHAASIIDWGNLPPQLLHEVNVQGTENIIKACTENHVGNLIYTSTMDVTYDGRPVVDADESQPYPRAYHDAYCETKALAEQLVIKANSDRLNTSVLRPCGIYGPADPYHIAESLKAVKSGALKVRVGNGSALFQHVYVGNVAHAHILLLKAMTENNTEVNGQIYLVADDPAENFFDFLEPIMRELGYPFPPKQRYIPYKIMYIIGFIVEMLAALVKPFVNISTPITRSSVKMLCEDLTIKTDKASRHFGYTPKYSKDEAFDATIEYFKHES
ncbi:MAG: NAD-dependent epimerase/dehydratase family protein [Pseudomonadales bacterium]|nr:NAD-dependent epimerase/dehydratase family protein [Pseudomonadales bacterium]